ncbi:hypothetical protein E2562_021889 [Oryza meyeriana var. granulata]|uniref:Uncharacterized protein n=1 Tax=Oryza meyeriana var. granulata TaxID=110450 RepID=A0A6G1C6R9_9ORYZ|nr:hypothetical protein E2562_021889 [Oryza meyeriana var. granulata]
MVGAWIYGLDEFDSEVFLPDLDNVQMDGAIILLPEHVIKILDDLAESSKQKAAVMDSLADVEDSDKVHFVVDSLASKTKVPDSQNYRL